MKKNNFRGEQRFVELGRVDILGADESKARISSIIIIYDQDPTLLPQKTECGCLRGGVIDNGRARNPLTLCSVPVLVSCTCTGVGAHTRRPSECSAEAEQRYNNNNNNNNNNRQQQQQQQQQQQTQRSNLWTD